LTADLIPEGKWRTGRTLVIQTGDEPRKGDEADGDTLVGYAKGPDARSRAMDTAPLARRVVDAVNGQVTDA
jgi:hypothetical protein